MKLRGAMEENSSISEEIAAMKVTLMKLQTERLRAGGRAAAETDAALAKVWHPLWRCPKPQSGYSAIEHMSFTPKLQPHRT